VTQLHFLGADGALPYFPPRWELERLGKASPEQPVHLDKFAQSAWTASIRLWVLDQHFSPFGFLGVEEALRYAKIPSVRIISEPDAQRASQLLHLRKVVDTAWNIGKPKNLIRPAPVQIEWHDRLIRRPARYPFAHDRFVVLDDTVWHFGFAACGSGNCLTAASGPWPDKDTRGVAFFEELWESLGH
jgi:hypothetical protein